MPAGTWEFRILGPLEVLADSQPVGLGGSKQRALLAFLLLHANEVVSRDRIIEALWSERPPGDAGHSLDVQISRLRKTLRVGDSTPERLITQPGGYELRVEPDELDMAVFERLADAGRRARAEGETALAARQLTEALALWRGPPIGDLVNEPFARTEIERLEALRLAALEERIETDLALGEHAELVPELETLVARHPLRERLYGQLMVALDRSGRRAQALGVYAEARRHLAEELGIEPGAPLRRLHETILGADPGVGPPAVPSRARRAPSRALRRVAIGVSAAVLAGALALVLAHRGPSGGAPAQTTAKTGSVTFLDSATGRLVGSAPVPPTTGLLRYGEGSFWAAADGGTLTQIDPKTFDVVRTIPVGVGFGDIAVGEGAVWVTDANSQTLLRVEPGYGTVDRSALPSAGLAEPGRGGGVAVGGGSVWVAHGNSRVERIDPTTRRVEHRFRVAGAQTVTFGAGAAWVASGDLGTLTKIDARTNSIAGKTALQPYVCCVAVGGGFAWATFEHTVWKVSPTGRPLASIRTAGGAGNVAYAEGALWVTNAGVVTRIDSKTDATRTFRVGHLVSGVAVHGGLVAVNVSPTSKDLTAGLRGQIVRLALAQDWLDTTDPAVADAPQQWQLEYATCAKLFNYPDAPAPRGWTLVPEAARAMPAVSRDGLTYTLQIRPGFQFSPPSNQAVTARTFRDTIERTLSPRLGPNAPAVGVVSAIVGAKAYRAGRARHIAGLTAHGATLRIRLRRRVPDLAQRMALPYFCAVPQRTPVAPNGLESPIPSAGPYYLSGHLGGVVAVVRRNPNYDGPRPHRIDAFLYREDVAPTRGADAVREGRADYVSEDDPVLAAGGPLQREFGSGAPTGGAARPHYALTPRLVTFELVFNTHRPPFANGNLRRVVNEALGRDALATAIGGLPAGQILPPGMPGFREARIQQLSGSDLRASLSRADRGARPAVLDVCSSASCHAVGELVRDDLVRIGIRLTVRSFANPLAHARAHPGRFDLLLTDTSAKYPDPVGFLRRALHGNGGSRASALLRHAARLDGPRRAAAIEAADIGLMRAVTPVAPLATGAAPELFGARIGCRIAQPLYFGVDLAALCIRHRE